MTAARTERAQIELRGLKSGREIRGAVLVLNGASASDLDRACELAAMLSDQCMLVAVDGGLATCQAARRRPDLMVGDGDSAPRKTMEVPEIRYEREKDFSDFAGALGEMRRRKVQVLVVAGLLGGRLDHEMANLQEIGARARGFAGILAPSDRGTILVTRHGCTAATVRRGTLSLFPMTATATVSLRGTKWELVKQRLRPGSLGLSNTTGTELDLKVHAGTVALIFVPRG